MLLCSLAARPGCWRWKPKEGFLAAVDRLAATSVLCRRGRRWHGVVRAVLFYILGRVKSSKRLAAFLFEALLLLLLIVVFLFVYNLKGTLFTFLGIIRRSLSLRRQVVQLLRQVAQLLRQVLPRFVCVVQAGADLLCQRVELRLKWIIVVCRASQTSQARGHLLERVQSGYELLNRVLSSLLAAPRLLFVARDCLLSGLVLNLGSLLWVTQSENTSGWRPRGIRRTF